MKCNRHVVKWENSPESSPGRSDASCWRNQPNDQRLVMTVNVGSITPSATYNKGRVLIVVSVGTSSGNAVETQGNSQLWTGRNPVGWSGITSGNQPRAGDVTGNTSTAWALDDSGTAGIWACGGWIGRDENQQSTDAREIGSHAPDNLAKGESSPMRHCDAKTVPSRLRCLAQRESGRSSWPCGSGVRVTRRNLAATDRQAS